MSERLEDIKNSYMELEYDFNLRKEDIDWLIRQAEQVEELKEIAKMQHDAKLDLEKHCLELEGKLKRQIENNHKLDKINLMMIRKNQQNKRYRKLLEQIYNHAGINEEIDFELWRMVRDELEGEK